MTLTLRPYQQLLCQQTRDAWVGDSRAVLNVLPTGGGKTALLADQVLHAGGPSCTIVHRQELLGQISDTYARAGIRHNIIAPQPVINWVITQHVQTHGRSFYDPRGAAAVAGVDTLIRRIKPGDRWANGVQLWLCDEAHHCLTEPANKWGKATQLFPSARGLGVTATPLRADNKSLHIDQGGAFDAIIQGPSMRDLIEWGNLCDYRVLAPEPSINEAMLRIGSTGDFTDQSVKAATKAELTGDIVSTYLQHTPGKQAIVFTTGVESSRVIAEAFNQAGVPVRSLDGNTPDAERSAVVGVFARGDIKVLVNTGLFDEGFDVPAVEVTIMARPTMSFGLFCQQIGRCLRPAPGKQWGIVIDHVGNVLRMAATHGMPDTPRSWELWREPGKRAARNPDALPVRVCAGCSLTYPAIQMQCPYCDHAHTPAGRDAPKQVDGILTEMSPELLERLKMARAQVWRDDPAIPHGADDRVVAAIRARHRSTQQAHVALLDAMEQWGGIRRAAGDTDEQMQARFLHRFGVDVMTAQTLRRGEALELRDTILDALSNKM